MRAAIAAFASSSQGDVYRMTCERWGIDPGAIFDDDVEAYLMRQALALRSVRQTIPEPEPPTDVYEEWAGV